METCLSPPWTLPHKPSPPSGAPCAPRSQKKTRRPPNALAGPRSVPTGRFNSRDHVTRGSQVRGRSNGNVKCWGCEKMAWSQCKKSDGSVGLDMRQMLQPRQHIFSWRPALQKSLQALTRPRHWLRRQGTNARRKSRRQVAKKKSWYRGKTSLRYMCGLHVMTVFGSAATLEPRSMTLWAGTSFAGNNVFRLGVLCLAPSKNTHVHVNQEA